MDKEKEKSPKIDKLSYGAVPRPFFKPSNNLINNYKSFKLEVEKDQGYDEYEKVMSELNSTNIQYNHEDIDGIAEPKNGKKDKDRKEFIIDRIKIEEHLDKLSTQY